MKRWFVAAPLIALLLALLPSAAFAEDPTPPSSPKLDLPSDIQRNVDNGKNAELPVFVPPPAEGERPIDPSFERGSQLPVDTAPVEPLRLDAWVPR